MRRLTAAIIGVTMLGAGLLVGPPAQAADPTTTITFRVTGCEGCVLRGANTPATGDVYNAPKARVQGGVATVTVPTSQTRGMYFAVEAPWKVLINAQPLLVFQYQGQAVGGRTTRPQAIAAKRASACWAGSTASTVELRVVVHRVRMPAFDPGGSAKTTQVPMAYVVPTQEALTPFWPLEKGVLATQNNVECGTS
jgi:hypothetical protein